MTKVMFYKSTRPQAPHRHKDNPALRDKVECSICRGLFVDNTPASKLLHRQWHRDHPVGTMPCSEAQKMVNVYIVAAPDGSGYQFLMTCQTCDEDFCPCSECQERHHNECAMWSQARKLVDAGKYREADQMVDSLLAARGA